MADELVVRGKLKLKSGSRKVAKKKAKSESLVSKEKMEAMVKAGGESGDSRPSSNSSASAAGPAKERVKTKAELAFEKRQAEIQAKRIQDNAQMSHRERVEKFNTYLENMTEINDIPKVSWTK